MRVVIVGMGVQGVKRARVASEDVILIVDPIAESADYTDIQQVPLSEYDAALVCTPESEKWKILEYLLNNKKHCLVEKPLIPVHEGDLEALIKLTDKSKVTCYTAYNHRFEPFIVRIKDILDSGVLGTVYTVRMYYGNGTSADVKSSSWRDSDLGVLRDLGSHLLDMTLFLFGQLDCQFSAWSGNSFETNALDHIVVASESKPLVQLEATLLSWKNTFTIDIIGSDGSAHMSGLCKWGPSVFSMRKRVFPSGVPEEAMETMCIPDPTWEKEYKYFLKLCESGSSNIQNDLWINHGLEQAVQSLAERAKV